MNHRGKGRVAILVELFFDAVLLLLFICQAFVCGCLLTFGHIPILDSWADKKITEQLPKGLSFKASNYNLTLDGAIEVENLELRINGVRQAIFEAENAIIELGWQKQRWFTPKLAELVLSNGQLNLPAVHSPSGKASSILERIALRLRPKDRSYVIDSFAALHEDIHLRGSVLWSPSELSSNETMDTKVFLDQFYKQAANIMKEKSRINGLVSPTIFFQVESGADSSLNIQSLISSNELNLPRLNASRVTLDTNLELREQTLVSKSSLYFKAESIELPEFKTRASSISALMDGDEWEALLKGEWPDMEIAARHLSIESIELESPRIKVHPQNFPEIRFEGMTSGLSGAIEFSGEIDTETRSGQVHMAGSVDLLSVATDRITEKLPPIAIKESPYYDLKLKFGEGFNLDSAELEARIDTLMLKDITFDHIRASGTYKDGIYSIDDLYLRRDWQWLDLSLQFDSSSDDYGLKLVGFAKPYDYNDILPHWWGAIFKDFDFESAEDGLGDFVIYGNTKKKAADLFFGYARAENISYKGIKVEHGDVIIRGQGPYVEVHKISASMGTGHVRGDIHFASKIDNVRGPMSVRLDLDTKLTLAETRKFFDENIATVIDDFETDALPSAELKGAIFNSKYPQFDGMSYLDLTVTSPAPLKYKGIQLDYIGFDLFGRNNVTYLRDIRFGFADGKGSAQIDVFTPEDKEAFTRFSLNLEGADQREAIAAISSLASEDSKAIEAKNDTSEPGKLDFTLDAQGPVADPFKLNGFGHFKIENKDLSTIDLFGPLSRLLREVRLGFTSFSLTEMEGSFSLKDETVNFNQLEINGPSTRILAPGSLQLNDMSLTMKVSVFLFGNAGNPHSNFRKLTDFITKPVPNLLEFELTGTVEKQKWRSLYDPRKFIPLF